MIPAATIEAIRQRTDLAEVASGYVSLRKRGVDFVGLCPFHAEKRPSFSIRPEKGVYHCFGCGEGGDVFSFVAQVEKTDFLGAVKVLAARAGVRLEGVPKKEAKSLRKEKAHKNRVAEKLAELERAAFLGCSRELQQLERLRRRADERLCRIDVGHAERFAGEADLAWFALAEVAAGMARASAAYTVMAFGTLAQRIDYALHPDRREILIQETLELGFAANERRVRHEVLL